MECYLPDYSTRRTPILQEPEGCVPSEGALVIVGGDALRAVACEPQDLTSASPRSGARIELVESGIRSKMIYAELKTSLFVVESFVFCVLYSGC